MNQQQKWQIESLWEKHLKAPFNPLLLGGKENMFDFSKFSKEFSHILFPNFYFVEKLSPQHAQKPVFFDDGEEFFGMEEYQIMLKTHCHQSLQKPIYLFDNHDLALIPFAQIKEFCDHTFDVVHIDAHRDDAIFPHDVPQNLCLKDIPGVLQKTRVSDYLNVATRGNIIGEIFSYTQSFEFEAFEIPKKPYILNLDLDIFGPEGTAIPTEKKVEVIAKSWKHASAVILATSPGYFDQDDAFWLAQLFTKE